MAYNGRSFMDISQQFQGNAMNASSMMRQTQEEPDKTVGGAIGSGAGMAMAGAAVAGASNGVIGGPVGTGIGFGVGLLTYLAS